MIMFINTTMEGAEAHRRSWEDTQGTENGNRKAWRFPYNHIGAAHLVIIMPLLERKTSLFLEGSTNVFATKLVSATDNMAAAAPDLKENELEGQNVENNERIFAFEERT